MCGGSSAKNDVQTLCIYGSGQPYKQAVVSTLSALQYALQHVPFLSLHLVVFGTGTPAGSLSITGCLNVMSTAVACCLPLICLYKIESQLGGCNANGWLVMTSSHYLQHVKLALLAGC